MKITILYSSILSLYIRLRLYFSLYARGTDVIYVLPSLLPYFHGFDQNDGYQA